MRFRSHEPQRGVTADAQTFAVERRALLPTLQSTIGNRSTMSVVQTLMRVGAVTDPLEKEADRVAREVAGTPRSLPALDPAAAAPIVGPKGGAIDAEVGAGISRARRRGEPIDSSIKRSMESSFGADFSGVRIHRDAAAAGMAARLGATAFTTGSDIFLGAGGGDSFTLAHELTHVVQQGGAGQSPVQRRLPPMGYITALLDSALHAKQAGEREPVEMKKLRKALLRTYEDFVAKRPFTEWYQWFNDHYIRELITTGEVDALQWLVDQFDPAADKIEWFHPGNVPEERPPTDAELPSLKVAVAETRRILKKIALGKDKNPDATNVLHRNLVANVFSSGWTEWSLFSRSTWSRNEDHVRKIFGEASEALKRLYKKNQIVADNLAESTQIGIGGLTNPDRMLLAYGMFDQIKEDPKDWDTVVSTLFHESFHAIRGRDITDAGGYRSSQASFIEQPYAVKIHSAPHFEEVGWQYDDPKNRRNFLERAPAAQGGGEATDEKHWQDGLGEATKEIRLAWTAASNGLDILKAAGRNPDRSPDEAFDHNTRWMALALGTTLNKRMAKDLKPTDDPSMWNLWKFGSKAPPPLITELDVALAEGVTRRLGALLGMLQNTQIQQLRTKHGEKKFKTSGEVKEAVLSDVLDASGPIRRSKARDRAMIKLLAPTRSESTLNIPKDLKELRNLPK